MRTLVSVKWATKSGSDLTYQLIAITKIHRMMQTIVRLLLVARTYLPSVKVMRGIYIFW